MKKICRSSPFILARTTFLRCCLLSIVNGVSFCGAETITMPEGGANPECMLLVDSGGALGLSIRMGPGLGDESLRYHPTLTGWFKPQVGLFPVRSSAGESNLAPALFTSPGFRLQPGSMDLRMRREGPRRVPSHSQPPGLTLQWSLPDGSNGFAARMCPESRDAFATLARFGYPFDLSVGGMHQWHSEPLPMVFSGAAGEVIIGLNDEVPNLPFARGDGPWAAPSGFLVVRGGTAYEFRASSPGQEPRWTQTDRVHYHLVAMRSATGTVVSFTYGDSGDDFSAACGGETVSVTLDGVEPSPPADVLDDVLPGPPRGNSLLRLRVTYCGSRSLGYIVTALVGPGRVAEGKTLELPDQEGQERPLPDSLLQKLQVNSVHLEGGTGPVVFHYWKNAEDPCQGPSGTVNLAPTLLQEIGWPGNLVRLGWEARPRMLSAAGESAGTVSLSYGVRRIEERRPTSPGSGATLHVLRLEGLDEGPFSETVTRPNGTVQKRGPGEYRRSAAFSGSSAIGFDRYGVSFLLKTLPEVDAALGAPPQGFSQEGLKGGMMPLQLPGMQPPGQPMPVFPNPAPIPIFPTPGRPMPIMPSGPPLPALPITPGVPWPPRLPPPPPPPPPLWPTMPTGPGSGTAPARTPTQPQAQARTLATVTNASPP